MQFWRKVDLPMQNFRLGSTTHSHWTLKCVQDLHGAHVEPVKWGCYLIVICVRLEVFLCDQLQLASMQWVCVQIYLSVGTFVWTLKIQNSWVKSLEINCPSIFTATLLKLMSIPCHVIQPCGMVLHMMNMQFPFERFQNISSTPSCKRCQAFWWEIYIKPPDAPKEGYQRCERLRRWWSTHHSAINTWFLMYHVVTFAPVGFHFQRLSSRYQWKGAIKMSSCPWVMETKRIQELQFTLQSLQITLHNK
jgi:hypothetical protein